MKALDVLTRITAPAGLLMDFVPALFILQHKRDNIVLRLVASVKHQVVQVAHVLIVVLLALTGLAMVFVAAHTTPISKRNNIVARPVVFVEINFRKS